MATYKTLGIILKRHNVNEADRILTILTEKKGKMRAIAKGVRRPLSKLGSHLEPLYLVNLMLAEGRNLDTVAGVDVKKFFANWRCDLGTMGRACRFGELVDGLTEEREVQEGIFRLLADCLDYLDKQPERRILDCYFEVNLLTQLGYRPELYSCVTCRAQLGPNGMTWSYKQGGAICTDCHGKEKGNRPVSADAVKTMRVFLEHEVGVLDRLELSEEVQVELKEILHEFVYYLNQKELVSDRFLRAMTSFA